MHHQWQLSVNRQRHPNVANEVDSCQTPITARHARLSWNGVENGLARLRVATRQKRTIICPQRPSQRKIPTDTPLSGWCARRKHALQDVGEGNDPADLVVVHHDGELHA